jgi:ribonuclease HI
MQYLIDNNRRSTNLYSDSRTAIWWIKKKTIRTTLPKTSTTKQLWSLIEKQLERLQSNTTTINVQKRETKERGEIPADFWRK